MTAWGTWSRGRGLTAGHARAWVHCPGLQGDSARRAPWVCPLGRARILRAARFRRTLRRTRERRFKVTRLQSRIISLSIRVTRHPPLGSQGSQRLSVPPPPEYVFFYLYYNHVSYSHNLQPAAARYQQPDRSPPAARRPPSPAPAANHPPASIAGPAHVRGSSSAHAARLLVLTGTAQPNVPKQCRPPPPRIAQIRPKARAQE